MTWWQYALLASYLLCSAALASYGLHGLWVLRLFNRHRAAAKASQEAVRPPAEEDWPRVTTQLPLFNEAQVAERLILAVAAFDYPADKHQIQILDDSTDECREIVDRTAATLSERGVDVSVLRRTDRGGYKAGALAAGLEAATGSIIAIFDADFLPPPDFLRRTVPLLLEDLQNACVQARWDHLNRDHSWLTRVQSVGIDGHFAIEQGARAWGGLMMNFNGTAGIWRTEAIKAAGGWQGDTITEDLDLSYRAQLAGYKMVYAFDVACPAEIPDTVDALKAQQRRWAKGSIQTARKLLPRIWRAPIGKRQKAAATFHLTHYCVSLLMSILALQTLPVLLLVPFPKIGPWIWAAWIIVLASALSPCLIYLAAGRILGHTSFTLRNIPGLIVLGSGLSLNNGLAVLEGLFGSDVTFVRTPKNGGATTRYRPPSARFWWAELLLGCYCAVALAVYLTSQTWVVGIFLGCYTVGFLCMGWASRPRQGTVPA